MKYILGIVLMIVLAVGYNFIDMYKKLASATALAEALKAKNLKLTKQNRSLSSSNKKLIAKQKSIHEKITQRRKKLSSANINKVKKKLATAGAKMAPFLGMPVVVGATVYEINDYCLQIDEMEQFEYELFGDANLSNFDKTICGIDIELQLQQEAKKVTKSYEEVLRSFNEQNKHASQYWSQKYQETTLFLAKESAEYNQIWNKKYLDTVKYLSEQNDGIVPFWKKEYSNLKDYWKP